MKVSPQKYLLIFFLPIIVSSEVYIDQKRSFDITLKNFGTIRFQTLITKNNRNEIEDVSFVFSRTRSRANFETGSSVWSNKSDKLIHSILLSRR